MHLRTTEPEGTTKESEITGAKCTMLWGHILEPHIHKTKSARIPKATLNRKRS